MKGAWFSGKVVGMMALALLLGAVLVPVVSAQSPSGAYAGIAGQWAGYETGPSGASTETVWRINQDGRFSVETDRYTGVGSLTPRGPDYAFAWERNGQTYTGTLTDRTSNGVAHLIGSGEGPNGPLDITLTR